ncbi:membrane protein [Olivibacter ginsenosidimutans]|uniref:Membrane protein n=2 Tax=Olivibacter ginsenosidimutans TaxID=1176537 RepID=A0ABP9AK53_9SPHI
MGGLSTGVRSLGGYSNINVANPAAYSNIHLSTFDIGAYMNRTILEKDGKSEGSGNFALNHINFAIPLSQQSAFSFGLMPFSDMGYNYSTPTSFGNADTTIANKAFAGEGGISKAYIGYGIQFGKHFSVGANISYLFGTLNNISGIEFPNQIGTTNSRIEHKREIHGFNYDLGVQYHTLLNKNTLLTLGYTNSLNTNLTSTASEIVTRISSNVSEGTINSVLDSVRSYSGKEETIKLPMRQSFGFSINRADKWLLGADIRYAKWSDYKDGSLLDDQTKFEDSYGASIGGQWTPDITSIKYWNAVDYRFGLRYDKTYLNLNGQNIKDMALSVGLGLPIRADRTLLAYYKINLSAEVGQRGTLSNNLVKERYFNFTVSFMLNDRWFQRYKYD